MAKNYIEAVVEQWLRLDGYITWANIPYWRPPSLTKRQGQWSDIDVLGLKPNEAVLVECEAFLGTRSIQKVEEETVDHFQTALEVLKGQVPNPMGVPCPTLRGLKDDQVRLLLVAETPLALNSYKEALRPKGVEVKLLKEVLAEILSHLRKHIKNWSRIGKHEDFLMRLLISLVLYDMLK